MTTSTHLTRPTDTSSTHSAPGAPSIAITATRRRARRRWPSSTTVIPAPASTRRSRWTTHVRGVCGRCRSWRCPMTRSATWGDLTCSHATTWILRCIWGTPACISITSRRTTPCCRTTPTSRPTSTTSTCSKTSHRHRRPMRRATGRQPARQWRAGRSSISTGSRSWTRSPKRTCGASARSDGSTPRGTRSNSKHSTKMRMTRTPRHPRPRTGEFSRAPSRRTSRVSICPLTRPPAVPTTSRGDSRSVHVTTTRTSARMSMTTTRRTRGRPRPLSCRRQPCPRPSWESEHKMSWTATSRPPPLSRHSQHTTQAGGAQRRPGHTEPS
mmetsp:Transcript_13771/g.32787  ORF Transcript_13771/g.32787 Transcript_13771/m.32787 type:complete len:326 (+) Transcript_13771:2530-3507(+)